MPHEHGRALLGQRHLIRDEELEATGPDVARVGQVLGGVISG